MRKDGLAHWLGFLVSGTTAYATDTLVLMALDAATGWPPQVNRVLSIAAAMVVGWQMHRRVTFAVKTPATLREFIDYATVGWSAALVNYLTFVGLLWAFGPLPAWLGVGVSSLVAMVWSYLGLRFHVFGRGAR